MSRASRKNHRNQSEVGNTYVNKACCWDFTTGAVGTGTNLRSHRLRYGIDTDMRVLHLVYGWSGRVE